jgi:uncharacterized protein (DUF1778 family)
MDKAKRVFLQILIDPDKKQILAQKAEQEGKNMTDIVLTLIDNYIDDSQRIDNAEIVRRLEAVEKFMEMEKPKLVGELIA